MCIDQDLFVHPQFKAVLHCYDMIFKQLLIHRSIMENRL